MLGSWKPAVAFFGKILAIYGLWYMVYDLWLLPDGRLDTWLSMHVAAMAGGVLSAVGYEAATLARVVTLPGVPGVEVINGCNGLTTIGLFIGFIAAYPGSWKRRLLFIPFGIGVIYATNVLRVAAMLWVQKFWPAAFDPLHGFGLTTIFYVVVFLLWMAWVNYSQADLTANAAAV